MIENIFLFENKYVEDELKHELKIEEFKILNLIKDENLMFKIP